MVVRKLVDHLRRNIARPVRIGREALRCLLARRGVAFQRTKTWKESPDPDFDARLARIVYAINERPDRTFAFNDFGPLGIRANPIEAHFGPLRQFTLTNSHHLNHPIQTRALHAYLR